MIIDASACVGKLPVEPFWAHDDYWCKCVCGEATSRTIQAHDENIFNESGETLKNDAILWQNLVIIRTLTNIHSLWTVQLVPVCIILSPHSFCIVIWSIAVNLYLQYINIKVCKITKKIFGEGYSILYRTFPPLLILTFCFSSFFSRMFSMLWLWQLGFFFFTQF